MAKFSVVKRSEIPAAPKTSGRLSARMREYDKYIDSLKPNEGGKLMPDDGETARGIALRISRAAKRRGREVETRVVSGAVYFTID
jgi:hypothetical protein